MLRLVAVVALCCFAPVVTACATTAAPIEMAAIQSGELGATQETAIKVRSVREEYQILNELGLKMQKQALSLDGRKAYDVLTVIDPETGVERQLWFDVSSFFGRGF